MTLHAIRRHLTQLPHDQHTIEHELAHRSRTPAGTRGGDPATGPLPGGTDLLSTAVDLGPGGTALAVLATWESDWRDMRNMSQRPRPGTLADICGWLHVHALWACDHHPAIGEFTDELADIARRVHRVIDGNDRWARTRVACWALTGEPPDRTPCGAPLWIDRLDPAYPLLVCRTCQATWTPEGLGDLRTIPLAIHDASALTGISENALRLAIRRGRIEATHIDRRLRIRLTDIWQWRISA